MGCLARLPRGSLTDDHPGLTRFVDAQRGSFERALAEIRSGQKRSHWMWYVFPQVAGLGVSATSRKYAIESLAEADAYLHHDILGPRLVACVEAALTVEGRSAREIFGSPDDRKLRSSATLFAQVSPAGSVFHRLLDKYFGGEPDEATLRLIAARDASSVRRDP
jgi:uncharacterized protein (DUF1810 family)